MATAKECNILIDYYVKTYKERYNTSPKINYWSARWGFDAVLKGISSPVAKKLIDYYFRTKSGNMHELDWFFYNYDRLESNMTDSEIDAERRRKLMEESKERAERWRQSGKQGIADN